MHIADLLDLERYPVHQPASAAYVAVVDDARRELRRDGCAVVKDLLLPAAVRAISEEIVARKQTTHYSTERINPYFHTARNADYPARHPVNTFIERSSGFIPGDAWGPDTTTSVLFHSPELARFVADCLEEPALHCYADPLAGLTANILDPGQQFTWHFDTNDFAVTPTCQA